MKTATIQEIKQELQHMTVAEVAELCLRLAKFKKENKELLTYLVFEANDPESYIQNVKNEVAAQFEEINKSNLYFAKKSLRKILRIVNKHIKYIGSPQATVELLIHFCKTLQQAGIPIQKNPVIANMYKSQLQKINTTLASLHEDLQYDYAQDIKTLSEY
jgi:hypothetical protein